MKRITNHTIYEIWNEYTAESVFVDHKPSKEEVEEIKLHMWGKILIFHLIQCRFKNLSQCMGNPRR